MSTISPVVYLGFPSYGNVAAIGAISSFLATPTQGKCAVIRAGSQSSLLCYGFNSLWAGALNARATMGVTHFAMIHADIVPEPFWLDILLEEMTRLSADVVSAVIPIKSTQGLTSTGIDNLYDPWHPRRLTMAEIMRLPETFNNCCCLETMPESPDDVPALLINTGLFLVDLRKAWVEEATFTIHDRIIKIGEEYQAQVQSEDWVFSRFLADVGARVFATRKVKLTHVGEYAYPNDSAWGHWETDQLWNKK